MAGLEIIEPRRRTRANRLAFNPPVRCPAGTPVYETRRGSGCRCAIEQNTLTAAADPGSLDAFCFGAYSLCSSWQAHKEWLWAGYRSDVADDRYDEQERRRRREMMAEQAPNMEVVEYQVPD